MKIAILGGSFDPPHLGHLFIAQQVKENLSMDQIWLMPLYQKTHQDKVFQKEMIEPEQRLEMTKLLENEFIKVSDFEIKHNQENYTLTTLQKLQHLHPEHTFYWITGSDQLASFQKYYKWQELVATQNLIIFPREHMLDHIEEKVKDAFNLKTIPQNVNVLHNKNLVLTNISSSKIRERVKDQLPISLFVPEAVEEYIKKNNLYGN